MPLSPGTRFGPYEVISPAGAGGMGEVYKARDTRLDRTVALKVLPESVAGDQQFRERFDREARAISALEHPHICPLYDVGKTGTTAFLVMQYLDGETLAERIARGPLPLDEALRHAIAIAGALDAAHSSGIVHRDLKPGNIMLTRTGRQGAVEARLLDFGLAKGTATPINVTQTLPPTMTTPLTGQGTILGTFQYMAPEQIEGAEADTRSDIWAFGCVLYEMLSGRRAFEGKSQASLIGSILKDEPPRIDAVQPLAPASLDHVVRRCLAKDPDDRWQHIRDVRSELQWIASGSGSETVTRKPRRRMAPWIAAAAVAGALLALAAAWLLWRPAAPAPRPVTRFTIDPPEGMTVLVPSLPAISTDGSRIVFAAGSSRAADRVLYVRAVDQPGVSPIPGTEGASDPFFSPDGQWLGFFAGGQLRKMPTGGGPSTALVAARANRGGTFTPDGRIVYAPDAYGPLFVISANGGSAQELTTLDKSRSELSHRYPRVLPDGRIVFGILTNDPSAPAIGIVEPAGGEHRVIVERAMTPQPLDSGHLLYAQTTARGGQPLAFENTATVMAARYRDGVVQGDPVPVLGSVYAVQVWGAAQFAAAGNGTFVSLPGPDQPLLRLVLAGRDGTEKALPLPARPYSLPRVSPDGRFIVTAIGMNDEGAHGLWLADVTRGVLEPLGSQLRGAAGPVWSADGSEIAFAATFGSDFGIASLRLANPGSVRRLTTASTTAFPTSWHPDGSTVAVQSLSMVTRTDVAFLSLDGGALRTFVATERPEGEARFSPDGKWIAFTAGNYVYVQPYPGEGRPVVVSPEGGESPVWSRTGRELFYERGDLKYAVSFAEDGTLGRPRLLFERRGRLEDVTPDGASFLLTQREQENQPLPPLVVTLGWLDRVLSDVR